MNIYIKVKCLSKTNSFNKISMVIWHLWYVKLILNSMLKKKTFIKFVLTWILSIILTNNLISYIFVCENFVCCKKSLFKNLDSTFFYF